MSVSPSGLSATPAASPEVSILIADRLPYFDPKGELASDCALVATAIEPKLDEIVKAFWDHLDTINIKGRRLTSEQRAQMQAGGKKGTYRKFADATGQQWVDRARDHAQHAHMMGDEVPMILSGLAAIYDVILSVVREYYLDDIESLRRAVGAVFRIAILEAEIMSATIDELKRLEVARERSERADLFRDRIGIEMTSASDLGTKLQQQAGDASIATRGMLGKASEVAAAAEQSATAMRDAAHTAAGLIRAIEDARTEVETAAEVATRASVQAGEAVKVSAVLSDTAKSIESILGLIRDVAGQTNLLALNATIEAARAGDAGRGFAVVAQEVKSLANQTARATDDIAAKIAAIQSATKSAVESNGSIRDTVAEVQASANRIREAMEIQAQTVTMITAAVDETALAADTMSTTIAAIREDTEEVATEIDSLESGFDSVNRKLANLQDAAGDYVKLVA